MEHFIHFLHHNLSLVCELMAILVEIWGTILLAVVLLKEVKSNVSKKFDFTNILHDAGLNHGLSTVLEIYLASEILKTVYADTITSLMSIGLLVVLRISMSVALHWEGQHKHSIDVNHYVDIDDNDVERMAQFFKGESNGIVDKIRDTVTSVSGKKKTKKITNKEH